MLFAPFCDGCDSCSWKKGHAEKETCTLERHLKVLRWVLAGALEVLAFLLQIVQLCTHRLVGWSIYPQASFKREKYGDRGCFEKFRVLRVDLTLRPYVDMLRDFLGICAVADSRVASPTKAWFMRCAYCLSSCVSTIGIFVTPPHFMAWLCGKSKDICKYSVDSCRPRAMLMGACSVP